MGISKKEALQAIEREREMICGSQRCSLGSSGNCIPGI